MEPGEISRAELEARLELLRSVLRAFERRHELLDAVTAAASPDEARAEVARLLGVPDRVAGGVLSTRVQDLTQSERQALADETEWIEQRLTEGVESVRVESTPPDEATHRRRLALLDAYLAAVDRRAEVIHAVAEAETPEAAARAVAELLGVDDELGRAVGELRVRALSASEVDALRAERDDLAGRLAD